jgi:hypothetical protein
MSRKVLYARLLSPIFAHGVDLGTVLPPANKTLAGLSMSLTECENLLVSFKYNARTFELLIKDATFMSLAPEEAKPAAKAKA